MSERDATDPAFWLGRWRSGAIGWHQPAVDPHLARWWPELGVEPGATVFVPLCGKSLDMRWLEERGHRVIGVELAEQAAREYFAEAGESPQVTPAGALTRYEGAGTTILVGDVFDLRPEDLAAVEAIHDRAALFALPPGTRRRYVEHLRGTLPERERLPMLLVTIEYDQEAVEGPPFSVGEDELDALFAGADIERLAERQVAAGGSLPPRFGDLGVTVRVHRIGL